MLNLRGSFVALVTPFKDGKPNEKKLGEQVEFHIENGTDGIVPCGTTGESATMTHEEHQRVTEAVIEAANGRISILAGTGSNNTEEALTLTKHAKAAGADGALLVSPYYNKPTQEGIFQHYKKINDEIDFPLVLYNVPGRTSSNILPETTSRLSVLSHIVGIKEASGDLNQISTVVLKSSSDFAVISGDDMLTLPILSVGGSGIISVVANIAPKEVADMVRHWENGKFDEALKLHKKLLSLSQAMFFETSPGPVKTAMNLLGMDAGELRLPLYRMSEDNLNKLKAAMREFGFSI